jgi:molecular chaperone GrpE
MTESTGSTAGDGANQPAEAAAPAPENKAAVEASVATADPQEAAHATLVNAVKEAAEFKDRLLRTLAEMENLRRRTEREVADARHYGIANFARDILGVADNMDRALQSLGANLRETADAGAKALLEGVELTERELLKVLDKHGVKKFEPAKGDKFDPNFHQAMYEVPDLSLPAGTVAQMVQAGYKISDRMLRPALVAVVKHPPKPAEKPQVDDPPTGAASAADENAGRPN